MHIKTSHTFASNLELLSTFFTENGKLNSLVEASSYQLLFGR